MKALQYHEEYFSVPSRPHSGHMRISDAVSQALEMYFAQMDGYDCNGLYDLVLAEVERPMLEHVMRHCSGNQTKAARVLGINRGTLRKKLKRYELNQPFF